MTSSPQIASSQITSRWARRGNSDVNPLNSETWEGCRNRWQYGELMPIVPVIGVGASPVAQWVILPLIQLWFVKRQIIGGRGVDA